MSRCDIGSNGARVMQLVARRNEQNVAARAMQLFKIILLARAPSRLIASFSGHAIGAAPYDTRDMIAKQHAYLGFLVLSAIFDLSLIHISEPTRQAEIS